MEMHGQLDTHPYNPMLLKLGWLYIHPKLGWEQILKCIYNHLRHYSLKCNIYAIPQMWKSLFLPLTHSQLQMFVLDFHQLGYSLKCCSLFVLDFPFMQLCWTLIVNKIRQKYHQNCIMMTMVINLRFQKIYNSVVNGKRIWQQYKRWGWAWWICNPNWLQGGSPEIHPCYCSLLGSLALLHAYLYLYCGPLIGFTGSTTCMLMLRFLVQ